MRVHSMVCYPELPEGYEWGFGAFGDCFGTNREGLKEIVAWTHPLHSQLEIKISNTDCTTAINIGLVSNLQDALNVIATRIWLGMLHDGKPTL